MQRNPNYSSKVVSANASLIAIITLALGFVYIALVQLDKIQQLEQKAVISTLVTLRTVVLGHQHNKPVPLTSQGMVAFSRLKVRGVHKVLTVETAQSYLKTTDRKELSEINSDLQSKFGDNQVKNAFVYGSVASVYSTKKACDVVEIHPVSRFLISIYDSIIQFSTHGKFL